MFGQNCKTFNEPGWWRNFLWFRSANDLLLIVNNCVYCYVNLKFAVVSAAQWLYSTRTHAPASTEAIIWKRKLHEDGSVFVIERIEKTAIKAYFRALFRHWREGTGEKHEAFQSGQLECRSRLQGVTSIINSWELLLKPACSVSVTRTALRLLLKATL